MGGVLQLGGEGRKLCLARRRNREPEKPPRAHLAAAAVEHTALVQLEGGGMHVRFKADAGYIMRRRLRKREEEAAVAEDGGVTTIDAMSRYAGRNARAAAEIRRNTPPLFRLILYPLYYTDYTKPDANWRIPMRISEFRNQI